MSLRQMGWLAGSALLGVALAALGPRGVSARPWRDYATPALLAGVVVALMIVGAVSGTVSRHVLQTAPLIGAVALAACAPAYGAAAALPLFTFWLGIMVSIWLYLLGVLQIFGGRFTAAEIALTIAMAGLCAVGAATAWRRPSPRPIAPRVAVAIGFGCLQIAALVASMR